MTQQPLGTLKNRASAIERWSPGSPRATKAREEYQRARLEQRVRELVEAAPPLDDDTRARLAVLLGSSATTSSGTAA